MIEYNWVELIVRTRKFVSETMLLTDPGHDLWHIDRVNRTALTLAEKEGADKNIVALAALLHDIADAKFHQGDEEKGPTIAKAFLLQYNVDEQIINQVIYIIRYLSFKSSLGFNPVKSIEFQVVQDADRLDAIGAIGIARAFSYGGFKGRPFYDPDVAPQKFSGPEAYKNSQAPTINHFYEKLLLLKDLMNTSSAKEMAQERHDFMLQFLDQFFEEWG
jgi:uncharacterized protein